MAEKSSIILLQVLLCLNLLGANDPIDRVDPSGNSWIDTFMGGVKSADDSFFGGGAGKLLNGIRNYFRQSDIDWDYKKSENEDFALGYKAGSYTNAVYGVINLASGLKKIATSAGTVIVNKGGVVVKVVSGSKDAVLKVIYDSGVTINSIVNASSNGGSSISGKPSLNPFKNNKEANKIAEKLGYEGAEELKDDFVGKANRSKFNMKYDKETKEIILEKIKDSSIQVHTGLYNK